MVILLQDCYRKGNSRNRILSVYVDDIKLDGKETKY